MSNVASPLPPRLRPRLLEALGPSLAGAFALLLVLPSAQIVDAERTPSGTPIEPAAYPVPVLHEFPDPPAPDPDEPPPPELDEPPPLPPDPFTLFVPSGADVSGFADPRFDVGYGARELVDEVVRWADLTVHPEPLFQPPPHYPSELRQDGLEGDVRLKYLIRADGSVGRIEVIATRHPLFAAAAEQTVRRWRFRPGKRHGRPVAVWVLQTLPFRIR